jgi:probable F420-dependent oxidoreductase
MRIGLTIPLGGVSLSELPELVRRAEGLGYDSVWSEESVNLDGVTPLVVAAQHSTRLRIASGVLNVFTRGRALIAQTAAAISELSRGRFVLGLGTSSNVIVEQWNGIAFDHPLDKMRATVENLRPILAGERGEGGFRLSRPPEFPVPIVIAALRPRMLGLAAEIADGAFTNFLPISGVPTVTRAFASTGKELACRFFCVPGPVDEALAVAKRTFVAYATVPVYTEFFRWLGWGASLDPVLAAWRAGDRAGAVEHAPQDLVSEIFLLGSFEEQRSRLVEFAQLGITTAILTPLVTRESLDAAVEGLAPSS